MKKFGLIGTPLTHSFSKKYFEDKFQQEGIFDCSYDLFELKSIDEFPSLLKANSDLLGVNVTIPYKESVMSYLDEVDAIAKEVGAVNCIKIENGKRKGYNTDCFGFENSLSKFISGEQIQAFVLGTGGSSKAVQYVLKKLNIAFQLVSTTKRNNCISYLQISELMEDKNLFISATPLGMFPNINEAPKIPYDSLSANDFLFDLVYNPGETEFLKRGKLKGVKTKNGLEMLELQAEKSWEIWNS